MMSSTKNKKQREAKQREAAETASRLGHTYILKVSIKKTCELMRKREQCEQQDGFANFGDRTPVSGHDRMTNIDVPRAGGEEN